MKKFFAHFMWWLLGWTGLVRNPNNKSGALATKLTPSIVQNFMHQRTVRPGTKPSTTGAAKLKNSRSGHSRNPNYARRRWAANHKI